MTILYIARKNSRVIWYQALVGLGSKYLYSNSKNIWSKIKNINLSNYSRMEACFLITSFYDWIAWKLRIDVSVYLFIYLACKCWSKLKWSYPVFVSQFWAWFDMIFYKSIYSKYIVFKGKKYLAAFSKKCPWHLKDFRSLINNSNGLVKKSDRLILDVAVRPPETCFH